MDRIHRGVVVEFDEARGLGTVRTDDAVLADWAGPAGPANGPFPFHCVAIADGTRAIAPGSVVHVRIRPGRAGRWEAVDLTLG